MIAASAFLSFAAAAPVQDGSHSGSLEARQAPSCSIGTQVGNLAVYDSSCWNTLNIMPYLTNWKATTPTCTDAENSSGQTLSCCGTSEPWSTCFLRLATKQANAYDCTSLTPTGSGPICSLGTNPNGGQAFALDSGLDPTIASQVNYIVLNLVIINDFFASYYTTLQDVVSNEGQILSSSLSQSASTKLDVMNVEVAIQNAMTALTLGLAFPKVSTPRISYISSDGTTTTTKAGRAKRDPQNPDTGTSSSSAPAGNVTILAGSICNKSWLASYYQNGRHHRRQQASPCANGTHIESDPVVSVSSPTALDPSSPPVVIFNQALQQSPNVASAMWPSARNPATDTVSNLTGARLGDSASFAPILTAGLQLIMNDVGTFIAFAGNGLFSVPLPSAGEPSAFSSGYTGALDTYVLSVILANNSISANPGSIVAANPCASGPLCTSSYWSPVTGRQYSFTGSKTYSLISEALANTEVDLPVLFDGAYNCTFEGRAGGSVVNLKADGSLDMACLSVLPIYVGRGGCPDGAVWVNGKCPFGWS